MKISLRMDSKCLQEHNYTDFNKGDRAHHSADGHVNLERTKDNINIFHLPARDAFDQIFQPIIDEYNDNQKRKDRRKGSAQDYYDELLTKKYNSPNSKEGKEVEAHPYYEFIVQVGNEETKPPEAKAVEIYKEYVSGFQKRNPNLVLIGAYIHLDETTPHLHIDYIPLGHNYKKGIKTQVGLNRAYEELTGYQSKNTYDTAQMKWQASERELFRDICLEHGIATDEIEKNEAVHEAAKKYRDVKQAKDYKQYEEYKQAEVPDTGRYSKTNKENVILPKKDYEKLVQQAKIGKALQKKNKELEKECVITRSKLEKYKTKASEEQSKTRELKKEAEEICSGEAYTKAQQQFQAINQELLKLKEEKERKKKEYIKIAEKVEKLKNTYKEIIHAIKEKKEKVSWIDVEVARIEKENTNEKMNKIISWCNDVEPYIPHNKWQNLKDICEKKDVRKDVVQDIAREL